MEATTRLNVMKLGGRRITEWKSSTMGGLQGNGVRGDKNVWRTVKQENESYEEEA